MSSGLTGCPYADEFLLPAIRECGHPLELTAQEMDRIEAIVPKGVAAGSRYNAAMATLLNG